MNSLSNAVTGDVSTTLTTSTIEAQFRGDVDALKALRDVLEAAGVFVKVDHEYRDEVWPEGRLVVAGLLVPAAERIAPDLEAAGDA